MSKLLKLAKQGLCPNCEGPDIKEIGTINGSVKHTKGMFCNSCLSHWRIEYHISQVIPVFEKTNEDFDIS